MMESKLSDEEIGEFNRLYEKGWALTKGELLLSDGDPSIKPGWFARRKLRQALSCFEAALRIVPESWQALWGMGKIHQRLGEVPEALGCFSRAHDLSPSQPDVAREAGIAACDIGDGPSAIRFTKAAIAAKPDDAGLVSNLALAYLIAGDLGQAQRAAAEAASRAPGDSVSQTVRQIIDDVAQGRRPRPRTVRELG
jgi:tetratricopeptide (TPR) repeat protein